MRITCYSWLLHFIYTAVTLLGGFSGGSRIANCTNGCIVPAVGATNLPATCSMSSGSATTALDFREMLRNERELALKLKERGRVNETDPSSRSMRYQNMRSV